MPHFAANFAAAFFDGLFGMFDGEAGTGLLQSVVGLALLWPLLAGHAKRCHDRGRTAWFILISFIPIVGAIWFLVELGILRGTQGKPALAPIPSCRRRLANGARANDPPGAAAHAAGRAPRCHPCGLRGLAGAPRLGCAWAWRAGARKHKLAIQRLARAPGAARDGLCNGGLSHPRIQRWHHWTISTTESSRRGWSSSDRGTRRIKPI